MSTSLSSLDSCPTPLDLSSLGDSSSASDSDEASAVEPELTLDAGRDSPRAARRAPAEIVRNYGLALVGPRRWAPDYSMAKLRSDVLASFTVAVMLVPQVGVLLCFLLLLSAASVHFFFGLASRLRTVCWQIYRQKLRFAPRRCLPS